METCERRWIALAGPGPPSLSTTTSILSRWLRWPIWCRWSGRTGRWCKRGLERSAGSGGRGSGRWLRQRKCEPTRLDEGDLAFRLAPRINAAGRLYRADAGVELFLTEDEGRAAEIANELGRANGERRATEREVCKRGRGGVAGFARMSCARRRGSSSLERDGTQGSIGIVASRLVERHHRPAVRHLARGRRERTRDRGGASRGSTCLAGLEACSDGPAAASAGTRPLRGLELKAGRADRFS